MSKRLTKIFLFFFLIIGILSVICLWTLSINFDSGFHFKKSEKVSYIKKEIRIPNENDLQEIEMAYEKLCIYFGSTDTLKEEIEDLYNDVTSAKVCSIANRYFNSLDEKFTEYNRQIEVIQSSISSFEDTYNNYLDLLDTIPLYAISLRNEKYEGLSERIDPLYERVQSENNSWVNDKSEISSMYFEAKKIADDLFEEYYELMCRIVNAEAGNCPRIERAYVANVIENRIAHYRFPNTIRAVIYASGQYEPVMTGTINRNPPESVRKDVEDYLRGRIETGMPDNVVYQALFIQGHGIWKAPLSGQYFCFY